VGFEPARGFFTYYGPFDLALLLNLCWRIGASVEDERVAHILSRVRSVQGDYGLWHYLNRPAASRWVTFDLLRSLTRFERSTEWVSSEPRTPFSPYPVEAKRY
jgi:hypothetical protein